MATSGSKKHKIPEEMLARLWHRRAALRGEFRTQGGHRLQVLYPGRKATEAGPDFRDALIYQEGLGLVRGDVELHLCQSDWKAHGHGGDPRYNGVILHGVLEGEISPTRLNNGAQAPVVNLASLLDKEPRTTERPLPWQASALWALLEAKNFSPPQTRPQATELLERAGRARFFRRSQHWRDRLRSESAHEAPV